jgi:hypothetical protein
VSDRSGGYQWTSERLEVTPDQIYEHFGQLLKLSGVPANFIFNLDEMGHQEWADRKKAICDVPGTSTVKTVQFSVSGTGKRISLIACISADGTDVRPSIVIQRATIEDEAVTFGLTPDAVEISTQGKSFVDRDIYQDWFQDTFLPEVRRRRERWQYQGPVFLVLDNCTAQRGGEINELYAANNVVPIFLPPHSSNQLQPLNFCVFGLTKLGMAKINKAVGNVQTIHIAKVIDAFHSAANAWNIISALRNAEISLTPVTVVDPIDGLSKPYPVCVVTPETCRCFVCNDDEDYVPNIESDEEQSDEGEDAPSGD